MANDYDDYDVYDNDTESYTTYAPDYNDAPTSRRRDTYAGFRIHRNEHISLKYDVHGQHGKTIRDENFGFGLNIGNRLTEHVKLEFETLYTGSSRDKYETNFDYDVWSNLLNIYLYENFGGAVEPYLGVGVGASGLWVDINGVLGNYHDNNFQLSFAAMVGINFALNKYVDLNLGARYVDYGKVRQENATTHIDATEIYIGVAYKFDIFD